MVRSVRSDFDSSVRNVQEGKLIISDPIYLDLTFCGFHDNFILLIEDVCQALENCFVRLRWRLSRLNKQYCRSISECAVMYGIHPLRQMRPLLFAYPHMYFL